MYLPTFSGRRLDCRIPSSEQIHIADIARGLSRMPRFAGQTVAFFSVAQHSLVVEKIARNSLPRPRTEFLLGALLNCGYQAYTGPMTAPVRAALDQLAPGAYAQLQARLACAIERRWKLQLDVAEVALIEVAEREALRCERDDVAPDRGGDWPELRNVLRPAWVPRIEPMLPGLAESLFMRRFAELAEDVRVAA